ncbi:unnamed protein product, partial [Mesorhabditis belari]|uniref:Uncharacterized protein n=1 Tax=Mesorhabditis belari TaxID=2138241 RepID=A0AAF3EK77_9BILA
MISLSRFLAVSFDGAYFSFTQKWPLIQLIIPYLLQVAIEMSDRLLIPNGTITSLSFISYVAANIEEFPYFLMIALDVVTYEKLKQRKRYGKPVSQTEHLLMMQMIFNSVIILCITSGLIFFSLLLSLFFVSENQSPYMRTSILVFFFVFISIVATLQCWGDAEQKSKLGRAKSKETCQCGSYCASWTSADDWHFWGCGCSYLKDYGKADFCSQEGPNLFGGTTYNCCSGDLCNHSNKIFGFTVFLITLCLKWFVV